MTFRATRAAAGAALALLAVAAVDASAATSMRAAVVKDGVIAIQSVLMPEPAAGQVRVRVRAASVNPVDWKAAGRAAPGASSTPGRDFAGVVDAVGPSVTKWKVGDAVTGIAATGTYAEYALASADTIAAKPAKMSFAEAAGLGVVAETEARARQDHSRRDARDDLSEWRDIV